jgi:hypothetical protein
VRLVPGRQRPLLIVTPIAHPEGIASPGRELADRWARWRACRRAIDAGDERPAIGTGERPPDVVPEREVAAAPAANATALQVQNLRVR